MAISTHPGQMNIIDKGMKGNVCQDTSHKLIYSYFSQ